MTQRKPRNSPITSVILEVWLWVYPLIYFFIFFVTDSTGRKQKAMSANYRVWNKELNKLVSGAFRKKVIKTTSELISMESYFITKILREFGSNKVLGEHTVHRQSWQL